MELLFPADEQEDMIDRYLDAGDRFVVFDSEAVWNVLSVIWEKAFLR